MKTFFFTLIVALAGWLGAQAPAARAQETANVTQLIRDSQAALAEEKAAEAEQLARRAVDMDPAHPPAWRQYGLALLRGGKAKEAASALQRAVSMDEKDATAWRGLALAAWKSEQQNEAVRALSAYLRLKPEDAAVWRDLASWMTQLQRGDQAVAALERVVALKPDDTSAWRELGSWLFRQGKYEQAAAALEKVVQAKPDEASAWRELATSLSKLEKQEQAVSALEQVARLRPDDAAAWHELASGLTRLSKHEQAASALQEVVKRNPGDAAAWRELAAALNRQEKFAAAADALQRVVTLRPDDAVAWRELASGLARQGKHEQAADALQHAVKHNPEDDAAWRALAAEFGRQARDEQAVSALEQVVRIKPDDGVAWRELANGLSRLQRPDRAAAAYERAIRIKPDDAAAWRSLALLHQRAGRIPEASQAFEKALALRPDDPVNKRDLGWLLWMQGRRPEAVSKLTEAVRAGIDGRERVIYQVVARLAEEGAGGEALAFLAAVSPDSPPSVTGLALARAGRLKASEPILAHAWAGGEKSPDIGLYLAYARAINGQFADLETYLEPLLSTPSALTPERADLALEALRLGSTKPQALAVVNRLEGALGRNGRYDARVTDILEASADASRGRSDVSQALSLYRRVLERDPERGCWVWALLLAERLTGNTPYEWLESHEKRVTRPARKAGVQGLIADRQGRAREAVAALRQSLALDPHQPLLRQALFDRFLRDGQFSEARAEAEWFARQVDSGEGALRAYLAEMLMRLGDFQAALGHWEILSQTNPDAPYYGIETGRTLFRLGRADEAMALLQSLAGTRPDHRTYEVMAEIASARARYAEAADWAARGLALEPTQGLLRYHAEALERLATNAPAALASARAFLKIDPGNASMTMLAGRLLESAGATNELEVFHREQVARNPFFVSSLTALRDITTRDGRIDEAAEFARVRCLIQTNNAEALRAYANTLAQQDHFRQSLEVLRPLARVPLEKAVPVLVYPSVSQPKYDGLNTVDQLTRHIQRLAAEGYVFINAFSQIVTTQGVRQVMIVLTDPEPRVIEALDPVLQRHSARVVYAGNAAYPATTLSGLPMPERLSPILASGRWNLASGGPAGLGRLPVTESGVLGNPLTHPVMRGAARETPDAFLQRISQSLADAGRALQGRDERILVLPSGDFGQRSLDTTTNNFYVLRDAVAKSYTHAVYFDDSGFYLLEPEASRLRIPSRVVPPDWDEAALVAYLGTGHPLARARLEHARVLYWHGQHEKAHKAFAEAAAAGANPRDLTFDWGMNADRQGDIVTAREKLRAAQALDPDSERIAYALERLDEKRRTQATAFLFGWKDNEDRDHYRIGAYGDAYVSERVRLGALADRDRWSTDDVGSEYGTRYGLRALAYLAPQIWFAGSLWELDMDDLDDHWGGEALLRLPNPWLSGYVMLVASREEVETVEALRENIDANTYALRSYTRLMDLFDLFADVSQIDRSDGNDTTMFESRLLYRLNEWPYIGVGWRFRYGDSDRDPPEYWAPEQLQQHQAHINIRGAWGRFSGSLSAEAGVAEEKDTDWNFVWGARASGDLGLTKSLSVSAEAGYFESTDYERLFGRIGLTGRF